MQKLLFFVLSLSYVCVCFHDSLRIYSILDKELYQPGDVLRFRVWAYNPVTNSLSDLMFKVDDFKYEIKSSNDEIVHSGKIKASTSSDIMNEKFAQYGDWRIPLDSSGGQFSIVLKGNSIVFDKIPFRIRSFQQPQLNIIHTFERTGYSSGDVVKAFLSVSRSDGTLLSETATVVANFNIKQENIDAFQFNIFEQSEIVPIINGKATIEYTLPHQPKLIDATAAFTVTDGSTTEVKQASIPISMGIIHTEFNVNYRTHEIIADIPNTIYFTTTDGNGNEIDIEAALLEFSRENSGNCEDVSSSNVIHQSIATVHQGRGRFEVTPKMDHEYFLKVLTPPNLSANCFPLPPVTSNGISVILHSDNIAAGTELVFTLHVTDKVDLSNGLTLTLLKDVTIFPECPIPLNITTPGSHTITIPLSSHTQVFGVITLQVAAASDFVLFEKLIFFKPIAEHQLNIRIETDKEIYQPGEEVELTVIATNALNEPVETLLGITVSDESVYQMLSESQHRPRFPETLLLADEVENELGGSIYLPQYYNRSGSQSSIRNDTSLLLDLLLSQQSWRKLKFNDISAFQSEQKQEDPDLVKFRRLMGYYTQFPFRGFRKTHRQPNLINKEFDGGMVMERMVYSFGAQAENLLQDSGFVTLGAQSLQMTVESVLTPTSGIIENNNPIVQQDNESNIDRSELFLQLIASIPNNVWEFQHTGSQVKLNERFDWTQTVYWTAGNTTSKETGIFKTKFKLSESITKMKILVDGATIAQSFDAPSRIGIADKTIQITQPFFLEAKLPSFALSGDKLLVPVTVSNRLASDKLENSLSLIQTGKGIRSNATNSQITTTIDANSSTKQYIEININENTHFDVHSGSLSTITLSANTTSFQDRVSNRIQLFQNGVTQAIEQSGILSADIPKSISVDIPADELLENSIQTALKFYPSPIAQITEAIKALLREPCGCFEQTSSTNYPNVMILQYFKLFPNSVDGDLLTRTNDLLKTGYDRLMSYETAEKGGFEWFGQQPAHEALTAYGLLQFHDMAKVMNIPQTLLDRVQEYLLSKRTSDGFTRSDVTLDSFGRAPPIVTNAYIVWALANAGVDHSLVEDILNSVLIQLKDRPDPYVLSLMADSLFKFNRISEGNELLIQMRKFQLSAGYLEGPPDSTSITTSQGLSLQIETTSLAILAWMNNYSENYEFVDRSVNWLLASCSDGRFGSTQATILALKALIAVSKLSLSDCSIELFVNNQSVQSLHLDSTASNLIEFNDFSRFLSTGSNQLSIAHKNCNNLPFSSAVYYKSLSLPSSHLDSLSLSVRLIADGQLAKPLRNNEMLENQMGTIRIQIDELKNETKPMTVALIGIPAGLSVDINHLENLVSSKKINSFEMRQNGQIVFYFTRILPSERIEIDLPVVASIPGHFTGLHHSIYQYYFEELKYWAYRTSVSILPQSSQ